MRFYVSLTWDNWPEGGSYATIVEATERATAEALARREMAVSRAEERELCYHCGADTDDGEGFDGLCGDCADRSSDDEGFEDPTRALEPTDAGAKRMLTESSASWHLVDCFALDEFTQRHTLVVEIYPMAGDTIAEVAGWDVFVRPDGGDPVEEWQDLSYEVAQKCAERMLRKYPGSHKVENIQW